MIRAINKDELLRELKRQYMFLFGTDELPAGISGLIETFPEILIDERLKAKWVPTWKNSDIAFCSNCELYWIHTEDAYDYNYCPHCGAKMEV